MELPTNDMALFRHRHVLCNRHPAEPVTGFCASCLRERLSGIDPDAHIEVPSTPHGNELRRSKSLSASFSTSYIGTVADQPRRRSCNVRTRNTLYDLFTGDDGKRKESLTRPKFRGLGFDLGIEIHEEMLGNVGKLRPCNENEEFKTMKEFIDLEWKSSLQNKKANRYYGNVGKNLREVASVFGKRISKWQLKQKRKIALNDKVLKTAKNEENSYDVGSIGCRKSSVKETQCEGGDYAQSRRSCYTYGRFSVDSVVNGRLSLDDSQQLCNLARASWDGCSIQNPDHHSDLVPSLLSVMEDVKLMDEENVEGKKKDTFLEGMNDESSCPGGTLQTRDYYYSSRRKSFERSSSNRQLSLNNDEMKSLWNVEVSPKAVSLLNGAKLLVTEKELRDSNWYAVKNNSSADRFDLVSASVDAVANLEVKKNSKGSQWWHSVRNLGNLMPRKTGHVRSVVHNVINKPSKEALSNLRGTANVLENDLIHTHGRSYTVSATDSCGIAAGFIVPGDHAGKRTEELNLQPNKNYGKTPNPSSIENGLLRFHLTPLWNHGRNLSGKSRYVNSCVTS